MNLCRNSRGLLIGCQPDPKVHASNGACERNVSNVEMSTLSNLNKKRQNIAPCPNPIGIKIGVLPLKMPVRESDILFPIVLQDIMTALAQVITDMAILNRRIRHQWIHLIDAF